jgi:Flp pilus assembly pilin Flp
VWVISGLVSIVLAGFTTWGVISESILGIFGAISDKLNK